MNLHLEYIVQFARLYITLFCTLKSNIKELYNGSFSKMYKTPKIILFFLKQYHLGSQNTRKDYLTPQRVEKFGEWLIGEDKA